MTSGRKLRRPRVADGSAPRDQGVALIVVIGIGAVLTLLVTAGLSLSLNGVVKAKSDQDWNGAVAAAYAGVDDYKSKLANDATYAQYGNPDAVFSAQSKAAGTMVMPTGAKTNPALGTGVNGTWATIAGGGGAPAYYRYEVDNSNYSSSGVLRLQSTGRVGSQTRSVVVNLKQPGFIDYLYFTNFEIRDPDLAARSASQCAVYSRDGRVDSDCGGALNFNPGDVIDGALHTNDTLNICGGTTFNGPVTTANDKSPIFNPGKNCSGSPSPIFNRGSPASTPVIPMPPSNSGMKNEAGCLYTGPTKIVFNEGGTMTVRSPWTKATSPSCGTPGASNLAAGQTIPVPASSLVYVQDVPIGQPSDPNSWPAASTPPGLTCTGRSGSTGAGNGIGYPSENEYAPIATTATQAYGCRSGDAFVEGKLDGAVTISAQNYLYVTGDITYKDPSADILGLVAEKAVWVWNPMSCTTKNDKKDGCFSNCNGNCSCMGQGNGQGDGNSACNANYIPLLDSDKDRIIDAAILSVKHTFLVQNYDKGVPRGNLIINGAIAQNFRGPVTATGAGSTPGSAGYSQKYTYDKRFKNIAPPKFLVPPSTAYEISVQAEVPKAFNADGSPA